MICGIRGRGKTYGAKSICIKKYVTNKEQFVWIRRYDTQLQISKSSFFKDMDMTIYGNLTFYVDGDYVYCVNNEDKTRDIVGYFIPLSKYETYKSTSYQGVTTIVFDEFITSEQYLRDEYFKFADLCETIARHRHVKILMMSNSLSVVNPYFENLGITKITKEFTKGDNWVLHYDDDKVFSNFKKQTDVGKLFGKTRWGEYAYDNKFVLDNDIGVTDIMPDKQTMYNLVLEGNTIGVYYANGLIYFGDEHNGKKYTPYIEDCAKNKDVVLIPMKDRHITTLHKSFINGQCFFKNQSIKNNIVVMCRKVGKNF